jgi:membrane-associated phospholipid phosphatase
MTLQELIQKDEAVSQKIARWSDNRIRRALAWLVARTGDSWLWLLISTVLIWQKQPVGWSLLITVAVAALLTAVAKGLFKRERPSEKWAISTDKYAFPSGHASRAGAVAVTLTAAFPEWGVLFFLWALLVCFARVALSRHFVMDVAGGLLFGIGVGLVLQLIFQLFL